MYERLADVTPEKLRDKLAKHRDQVFMGRELTRIVRDLPITLDLEAARLGDYDRDTVVRLFREYELRTLIERLPPMAGERRRSGRTVSGKSSRAGRCQRHASPVSLGRAAGARLRRRPPGERVSPAAARLRRGRVAGPAGRRARRRTARNPR